MKENSLDITKNIFVASPAGSGKTEKLAHRYVEILKRIRQPQRILAITFTEKAAVEMKDRVLKKLREIADREFEMKMKQNSNLMRISTMHSFFLNFLKRSAFESGFDPNFSVIDPGEAAVLFGEISEEIFRKLIENKSSHSKIKKFISEFGWKEILNYLNSLFLSRPITEEYADRIIGRILKKNDLPHEEAVMFIYWHVLQEYKKQKMERGLVDFADMEYLCWRVISGEMESWANVLFDFDEKVDHILIDEFQDTNFIQWRIIDKLTEEWRSGYGAKMEIGKIPTIFLVGDEKQSIYLFRGANVEVMRETDKMLREYFGPKHYEKIYERRSFRCLPNIVNFVNRLFSRIMKGGAEAWKTKYEFFESARYEKGSGVVEIIPIVFDGPKELAKKREAEIIAMRIASLIGQNVVYENGRLRECRYGDITILLKQRTHLPKYERALRDKGIPFVVYKGIGFFQEKEVVTLMNFLKFLITPHDDVALYILLKSPMFRLSEDKIFLISKKISGKSLFEKIMQYERIYPGDVILKRITEKLDSWLKDVWRKKLSRIIDDALIETNSYQYLSEEMQIANVRKFINMLEEAEEIGKSPYEIYRWLKELESKIEIPKANVLSPELNAVTIMTIHAAKGMGFPVVFLVGIDDQPQKRVPPVLVSDSGGELDVTISKIEDVKFKQKVKEYSNKKKEEDKRLFYVAVTRAKDFLVISGSYKDGKKNEWWDYLVEAFGFDGKCFKEKLDVRMLTEEEIIKMYNNRGVAKLQESKVKIKDLTSPLSLPFPEFKITTVSELVEKKEQYFWGGEKVIGIVIHKLLEAISRGSVELSDIDRVAIQFLRGEGMLQGEIEEKLKEIRFQISKLVDSGLMERVVKFRGYAELPFFLKLNGEIISGRIDKLIFDDDCAYIYDYKTFPVKREKYEVLINSFKFQFDYYSKAVEKIFRPKSIKKFILLTKYGELLEVK